MPLRRNAARIASGALATGIMIVTLASGSADASRVIRKPESAVGQVATLDSNVIRKPE
ncbi:hypothetical protein [Kibdelosporangium aridum]|uniref:hypothetical protein n=1 Tax=Kibdelosporangium aridum TaxID=2030 RepID=UPI0035E9F18D